MSRKMLVRGAVDCCDVGFWVLNTSRRVVACTIESRGGCAGIKYKLPDFCSVLCRVMSLGMRWPGRLANIP